MLRVIAIGMLSISLLITGCSGNRTVSGIRRETSSYYEKVIDLQNTLNLSLDFDNANIEVYSWDRQKVKFELTKRAKGSYDIKELEESLEDFRINIEKQERKVICEALYDGSIEESSDIYVDVRIYIPKKINEVTCELEEGNISFFDDIRCTMSMNLGFVKADFNKFIGKLNYKGDLGSLKIDNGEIAGGSNIKANMGNIDIKAAFINGGEYSFETETGNIRLRVPYNLKASFECIGNIGINEFAAAFGPTRIKVTCGKGQINIEGC